MFMYWDDRQDHVCIFLLTLSSPLFLHAQEDLPLQDTGASAPPSGAQRLCFQPDQK